jgi:bla regulator protein blaR1
MVTVKLLPTLLLSVAAFAQGPDTFEVASIKPADPLANGMSINFQPGASVKIDGCTLQVLVQFAYDLRDFQVSGASGWMTSDRYAILAKGVLAEGPADYRQMNDAQRKAAGALIRKRLQALLAERFKLVLHKETRELPVYALVLAKGGSKLTPNPSPDGSPQSMRMNRGAFEAKRASPDGIAQGLSDIVRRPVHDETGLQGFYDFKMEWTPDAAPAAPGAAEKPPELSGPTIFTALQEQLGLKLESRKGPVEVVVIDSAAHPSEN